VAGEVAVPVMKIPRPQLQQAAGCSLDFAAWCLVEWCPWAHEALLVGWPHEALPSLAAWRPPMRRSWKELVAADPGQKREYPWQNR